MNKYVKLIFIALLTVHFSFINSFISFSQQKPSPCAFQCTEVISQTPNPNHLFGGNFKPERTDNYQGTNDSTVFPVIIVFVKFASDEPFPDDVNWPAIGDPVYLNDLIASHRNNNFGDQWWNAYSQEHERLSDFWMEVSRGHMHIAGKVFSFTLPLTASQYKIQYGAIGVEKINDYIYTMLCQLISPLEWKFFDQWKQVNGVFVHGPDNYIDMIYKVHRSYAEGIGMPAGGIAFLNSSYQFGVDYPIINTTMKINGGFSNIGSGISMSPGSGYVPLTLQGLVSFSSHEHGHYLFGVGHSMYGKMAGVSAEFGLDERLSPWESIKLGYITPKVVDFGNTGNNLYQLDNFASRNSTQLGEILKVPIDINEHFLLASRGNVSTYDKVMWGDTAHGNPYRDINPEYGTGLYIYHTPNGYSWPPLMDMECADGLWDYTHSSWEHPDWDTTSSLFPFYQKVRPVFFLNDESTYDNISNPGVYGLTSRDGKSANKAFSTPYGTVYLQSYFGIGKKEEPPGSGKDGKDKIYSNEKEVWTSREYLGDRWDAWNIGYNQVFSPYSSPSTVNWNNLNTGIFIYYESETDGRANIKVYKESPFLSLDTILYLTPPSKPVINYKIDTSGCIGSTGYPRISWYNNKEPDMARSGDLCRYVIYRAYSENYSEIPVNYGLLASYSSNAYDSISYFIDTTAVINCSSLPAYTSGILRYKVMAVDKYDSVSVLSDFASIGGVMNLIGIKNNSEPVSFSISSYPNPFNPITSIKYSVSKKVHVKIRIYNITGQELITLINENKTAGTYTAKFDGTNFASGVYFCRIEASRDGAAEDDFIHSIKIVLVK